MAWIDEIDHKSQWLVVPIGVAIIAIFLPLSSLGYLAVKITICGSAVYALRRAKQMNAGAVLSLVAIAILFNPIIPVYLRDRALWIAADLFAAAVFFLQIKFSRTTLQGMHDFENVPTSQPRSLQTSEGRLGRIEKPSIDPAVLEHLSALIANYRGNKKIEEQDEGHLRLFLGYCSGFVLFIQDPKGATYLLNAGIWVKQSFWGKISSQLNATVQAICSQRQISVLLPLIVEELIFDEHWQAGYKKGLNDARLWAEGELFGQDADDA